MTYNYTERNGQKVEVHVAAAYDLLAAAFKAGTGKNLHVTSGTRSSALQKQIFVQRYRATGDRSNGSRQYRRQGPYNDGRFWDGQWWYRVSGAGNAAIPGTSPHEEDGPIGPRALDLGDDGADAGVTQRGTSRDRWMERHAGAYGFDNTGYNFDEAWHKQFTGKIGGGTAPAVAIADPGRLVVDGSMGPKTIARVCFLLHASKPEYAIGWIQPRIKSTADGIGVGLFDIGRFRWCIKAMQMHLGTPVDGIWSPTNSTGVKAWQTRLNSGRVL